MLSLYYSESCLLINKPPAVAESFQLVNMEAVFKQNKHAFLTLFLLHFTDPEEPVGHKLGLKLVPN